MKFPTKKIYLVRHGETPWTLSGRHTGTTDISLTKKGENEAALVGKELQGHTFNAIFYSPLKRAASTCQIAGFWNQAQMDPDLVEWNYGDFEGLTTEEIWEKTPEWNLFLNGAPQGESVNDIDIRARRVLNKIQAIPGDIALFSHGHFLRALTACWLQLAVKEGRLFGLSPSSISILGFERSSPIISLWNNLSHLGDCC